MEPHKPIKYGFDLNNPPTHPDGHFLPSFDERLWLFHRRWDDIPMNQSHVIATLMILHGTVDHSGTYSELAQILNAAGIAVIGMDMRGWGRSDGESMYMYDMDVFVQDVVSLYEHVHTQYYQNVKHRFILGKSLGGTVAAFCVAQHPEMFSSGGFIGLSGAFELDPSMQPHPMIQWVLKKVGRFFSKLPFKPLFDEHGLVADETALQTWRDDPLCCKDRLRLGYGMEFIARLEELKTVVSKTINVPTLMLYGLDDPVVTLSGHEIIHENNQHSDKIFHTYPKGRHNMLMEPSLKDTVVDDIRKWIVNRSK